MNAQERRSRQHYSPELKLKLVKMALSATDKGSSVAALAREYNINDNLLFKWIRLWQSEGRVSRPRRQYRNEYASAQSGDFLMAFLMSFSTKSRSSVSQASNINS